MIIPWKTYFVLYICGFILQYSIFYYLLIAAEGYRKAHLLRARHTLWWSQIFLLGSVFIWRRVQLLFEPEQAALPYDNDKIHFGNQFKKVEKSFKLPVSVFTVVFLLCMHFSYLTYYVYPSLPGFVCNFLLICLGVWTHLVPFLLGFGLLNFFVRILKDCRGLKPVFMYLFSYKPMHNILLNSNTQTILAIVLSLLFSLLGIVCARNVNIHKVDVKLSSLNGLKIALLSDIHVGPNVDRSMVENVARITNEAKPDIIAIVGDLVDGEMGQIQDSVEPIGRLQAKYGVFYVTGNHEYYYGKVDDWIKYLRAMSIKVLRNTHQIVKINNNQSVCLAGVDDISSETYGISDHKMDIGKSVSGCEGLPTVLLVHKPQAVVQIDNDPDLKKKIDLILCGHVHAGQLYPVAPLMYFLSPYFHGLYELDPTTHVYVSAGVHFWAAPMKMVGLAEITLINIL